MKLSKGIISQFTLMLIIASLFVLGGIIGQYVVGFNEYRAAQSSIVEEN